MKNLLIIAILLLGMMACTESKIDKGLLRHVVLFEWKEGTTEEQIAEMIKEFELLPSKIDVIQGFEYGKDVSVEGLQKGYSHCFILTFKNETDRNIYLPHPAHKAFGKALSPYLGNVLVIDYFVE